MWISFRLNQVIASTSVNQIIIQINSGMIVLKLDRSELGHTLKSSIINNILATARNCKTDELSFVFLAIKISDADKIISRTVETMLLNQKIEVNIINQAKKYKTEITIASQCFILFDYQGKTFMNSEDLSTF